MFFGTRSRWRNEAVIALIFCVVALYFLLILHDTDYTAPEPSLKPLDLGPIKPSVVSEPAPESNSSHPIDILIVEANARFNLLFKKRSSTVGEAASCYRERRGRHPPPGFDIWFREAETKNAIIVEEFFDRIHHDINPFWAIEPRELRRQTRSHPQIIRVRKGWATFETDDARRAPWIQVWTNLIREIAPHLPDLDLVVNIMDETRILVPWEKINSYVEKEQADRRMEHPNNTISTWSKVRDEVPSGAYQPNWITDQSNRYWDHLRVACPPDSPAQNFTPLASFDVPIDYPLKPMPHTFKGFVQNWTLSQDPCFQPHLRGMHGTFIESVSMSTTHELLPMFAGCKLPQNNEILIPGAAYLDTDQAYTGGNTHGPAWIKKKNTLIWRGVASGGRHKPDSWWHFHRHRWVQMMNVTAVEAMEIGDVSLGPTFRLLPRRVYDVPAQQEGRLGQWLRGFADVAFNSLECVVPEKKNQQKKGECVYSSPFYSIARKVSMKAQYFYKYLPDVDGNSFSGRWRGFLLSTSMPLKASIYTEWHDDRIIPWVHFVPFDSSYMDIYAIMDYFLDGHDAEAQKIAEEGKAWAEKVYRREDMKLYVWRLLLEYARVVDDSRQWLGYVEDLR